jgi:Plasmid pRiA4b ORF-3-like protein
MGWTNSHRYEIRERDVGWRSPDPDFGDGWEHSVRIERITDAVPGIVYPRLIEAAGYRPPEDVGGPWGYREFLDAIADPNHQEHAERLQWIGGHFDPTKTDAETLAQAVQPRNEVEPQAVSTQTKLIRGLRRTDTRGPPARANVRGPSLDAHCRDG